jgi:hypothetical protein
MANRVNDPDRDRGRYRNDRDQYSNRLTLTWSYAPSLGFGGSASQ